MRRGINRSRRAWYSAIIAGTSPSARVSAASAPTIANEVGLPVAWLWMFDTARETAGGAKTKPSRQPVIAKVFENEPTITTVSGNSAARAAPLA